MQIMNLRTADNKHERQQINIHQHVMDPRIANSKYERLQNKIFQQHKENMREIRINHSVEEIMEKGLHLKSKEAARAKIAPDINWDDLENCPKGSALLKELIGIRDQISDEANEANEDPALSEKFAKMFAGRGNLLAIKNEMTLFKED